MHGPLHGDNQTEMMISDMGTMMSASLIHEISDVSVISDLSIPDDKISEVSVISDSKNPDIIQKIVGYLITLCNTFLDV